MLETLGRHVRHNIVGYVALFVALGGTTYATTGGNFILGQANTAGSPTTLSSGVTGPTGAFKVTNTGAGRAITAVGASGGYGVYASGGKVSRNTAAVHGQSSGGNAVEGFSTANPGSGVYGQNNNSSSYGVAGHSSSGIGVVGDSSSGWAMQALGNTTQARSNGGFAKAMAHVDSNQTPNPIGPCFNSQLSPAQATSGTCGMTFTPVGAGVYDIDFGFRVDDRFPAVTANGGVIAGAVAVGQNKFRVSTFVEGSNSYANQPFYIVVY